jgi:CHAD domain-containing protein
MGEFLLRFFRQYYYLICEQILVVQKHPEMEAIHLMRTSTRRLSALLDLLQLAWPQLHAEIPQRTMEPIFKISGKVRDLQVSQEMIRSLNRKDLSGFDRFLDRCIPKLGKSLASNAKALDIQPLRQLHADLEAVSGKAGKAIENKMLSGLNNLNRHLASIPIEKLSEKELHRLRIEAKRMRYGLEVFVEYKPSPGIQALLEEMTQMHKLMGLWHDYLVLRRNLKLYRKSLKSERSKAKINMLRAEFKVMEADYADLIVADWKLHAPAWKKLSFRKLTEAAMVSD